MKGVVTTRGTHAVSLLRMGELGFSGQPGKKLLVKPGPTTRSVESGNMEASPT